MSREEYAMRTKAGNLSRAGMYNTGELGKFSKNKIKHLQGD